MRVQAPACKRHLWQIPQTWPLLGLAPAIGLLMQLRKDLYVLVAFHFFINMWLAYGDYPVIFAHRQTARRSISAIAILRQQSLSECGWKRSNGQRHPELWSILC